MITIVRYQMLFRLRTNARTSKIFLCLDDCVVYERLSMGVLELEYYLN